MTITNEYFGNSGKDKNVHLYTLLNDSGMQVKVTNYGACITSIVTKDKKGKAEEVTLGFDSLEEYEGPHAYLGVVCGRYANRISNGQFTLDGTVYQLAKNNEGNSLHGGIKGFDKVVWNAKTIENDGEVGVCLTYSSPDGDEGYPGKLDVEVTYLLNNKNEIAILYKAQTNKRTIVNLTNHAYFNLNGMKHEIYDHVMHINAEAITVNINSIPTGEIMPVRNTGYDFTLPSRIGDTINRVGGYDNNYIIKKNSPSEYAFTARLVDPKSGRCMDVHTTEPAVQFYSANYLDGTTGRNGIRFTKHMALCLETQHYPDSPNHPEFPSTVLSPDETYTQKTVYKFGIVS